MASASGGNRPSYAACLNSLDYSIEDVKKFKTRWFRLISLNKSMSKLVKNIDKKVQEFGSVRSCGMQTFEKKLGGKMYKCYAYSITFDKNHPDFLSDDEKISQVLNTGVAALAEIDSDELDTSGEPNLKPVMGLEFQFSGGVVNKNFDLVIEGIKNRFKDYATFSGTTNSAVSFIDKKIAKLRIPCDSIKKRPSGSYDMTLGSGRYFSVLARCFGVAPDENVTAGVDDQKRCYKCRSKDHLVANCPLRQKNKKNSESPKRPRRKRKCPERLGIQRSNNNRSINFDSESEIELPERNSEPISTDKLFESSEDEEEIEPKKFFSIDRKQNREQILIKAVNDASSMSQENIIYYRGLFTDKFENQYFNELQDSGPLPNETDPSLQLTVYELVDHMLTLKKDEILQVRKYEGVLQLIEECET